MTTDLSVVRVRSAPTLHEAIRTVGTLDARRQAIRTKLAKRIADAKAKHADELAELDAAVDDQVDKIRGYVAKNRAAVFGADKSVMTEAGELALRALPTSVEVEDEAAALEALTGTEFVRVTVALDKRALVKHQPEAEGLAYVEGREKLFITPITSGDKVAVDL